MEGSIMAGDVFFACAVLCILICAVIVTYAYRTRERETPPIPTPPFDASFLGWDIEADL